MVVLFWLSKGLFKGECGRMGEGNLCSVWQIIVGVAVKQAMGKFRLHLKASAALPV